VEVGAHISRNDFLRRLVNALYSRTELSLERGQFRVKGDTVDIRLAYEEIVLRVMFWGDEIESIQTLHPIDMDSLGRHDSFNIFPANLFITSPERQQSAIAQIQLDLGKEVDLFNKEGKVLEASRLYERVTYDVEMIKEIGHCAGIENYSRYFDGRDPGMRPFCLLDYFPKDFLTIIDESHVTVPQVRAMYGGDLSRKINLVQYGFRLPAALDNRPLKFEEFESLTPQTIYVSATPADYELNRSEGVVVEQVIRPTGLLDPKITVLPSLNQIDRLLEEIQTRVERNERTLVTTLTKRMAEELNDYFLKMDVRTAYIHSDVETMDRIKILDDLRAGTYDVLIGVNLLREGLDLPEVSLVAILDADKEGFLRNHRSLTQTVGRAARNLNGEVIMFADKITESMQRTIDETERRRTIQMKYNADNGITPTAIVKPRTALPGVDAPEAAPEVAPARAPRRGAAAPRPYVGEYAAGADVAADPVVAMMSREEIEHQIERLRSEMLAAAKDMQFIEAARLRDEMLRLTSLAAK
jgi:excinuclease ABC subunit B